MGLKLKLKTGLIIIFCTVFFIFRTPFSLEKKNEEEEEENEEIDEIIIIKNKRKLIQRGENGTKEDGWKEILLWTEFFYSKQTWGSIFKRLISGECEESRCKVTASKLHISTADAVIFNAYNLMPAGGSYRDMASHVVPLPSPKARMSEQIYVFYSMEPPTKIDANYLPTIPENFFNWTMGYRKDSDVFEPFGKVIKREQKLKIEEVSEKDLAKKKMAVWIASSCYKKPPYLREEFVTKLRNFIDVDVFGECGKQCDNQSRLGIYGKEVGESACEKLAKNYVFYLALENSFCTDYVTEKVFKAWKLGLIPVVFGAANYSSFAPPNSYIDPRDFDSVTHLTAYMKRVASNSTLYNLYFAWKSSYKIEIGSPYKPFICDLCKKLHNQDEVRSVKSYRSIYDWFVRKGSCQNQTQHSRG